MVWAMQDTGGVSGALRIHALSTGRIMNKKYGKQKKETCGKILIDFFLWRWDNIQRQTMILRGFCVRHAMQAHRASNEDQRIFDPVVMEFVTVHFPSQQVGFFLCCTTFSPCV